MKALVTLGLLTLLYFLLPRLAAGSAAVNELTKGKCCPGVGHTMIPTEMVERAEMTSDDCKPKAIIVTTKKNKKFCIDPEWKFAKNKLKNFLKPSNSTTS